MKKLTVHGLKALFPFIALMLMSCKKQPMPEISGEHDNPTEVVPNDSTDTPIEPFHNYYWMSGPYDTTAAYVIEWSWDEFPHGPHPNHLRIAAQNHSDHAIRLVTDTSAVSRRAAWFKVPDWWHDVSTYFDQTAEHFYDCIPLHEGLRFDGVVITAPIIQADQTGSIGINYWDAVPLTGMGCQVRDTPVPPVAKSFGTGKKAGPAVAAPYNTSANMLRATQEPGVKKISAPLNWYPIGIDPAHAAEYVNDPDSISVVLDDTWESIVTTCGNFSSGEWHRLAENLRACIEANPKVTYRGNELYYSRPPTQADREFFLNLGITLVEMDMGKCRREGNKIYTPQTTAYDRAHPNGRPYPTKTYEPSKAAKSVRSPAMSWNAAQKFNKSAQLAKAQKNALVFKQQPSVQKLQLAAAKAANEHNRQKRQFAGLWQPAVVHAA